MNTQDIKHILEIDHTDHDNYIRKMIPLTIDVIKNYTKNDFMVANPDYDPSRPISSTNKRKIEKFEGGVEIAVAKIIEFYMLESGVQSETISKVSTSFATDLPKSILDLLKPYKRMKFL